MRALIRTTPHHPQNNNINFPIRAVVYGSRSSARSSLGKITPPGEERSIASIISSDTSGGSHGVKADPYGGQVGQVPNLTWENFSSNKLKLPKILSFPT